MWLDPLFLTEYLDNDSKNVIPLDQIVPRLLTSSVPRLFIVC